MNSSYKIALLVAIVLCGMILGYYIASDKQEDPALVATNTPSAPAAAPPAAPRATANTPGTTSSTPPRQTPPPAAVTQQNSTTAPTPDSTRLVPPPPRADRPSLLDSVNAHARQSTPQQPGDGTSSILQSGRIPPPPAAASTPPANAAADMPAAPAPSSIVQTPSAPRTDVTNPVVVQQPSSSPTATRTTTPAPAAPTQPRTDQPTVAQLPNTGRAALRTPVPTTGRTYTIKEGDTFTSIARETLGSESLWHAISEANPYLDAKKLKIGTVIRLPYPDETPAGASKDGSTSSGVVAVGPLEYVVREGDTLSKIARVHYSDPNLWEVIHRANRDKIGSDPANIRPGMKLFIPPSPRIAQ